MKITDLPPEMLELIFSYLQLNLQSLLELALVCRVFRDVAYRLPVPIKIPLQDKQLEVMRSHQIPVSSLANKEPSLFVKYQIGQLNLRRLTSAQLVAGDYLAKSNMVELSSHYVQIVDHISKFASNSLQQLMLNVDLKCDEFRTSQAKFRNDLRDRFRCSVIICRFKNLKFLAVHFTHQIELQQRVLGQNSAQTMLWKICGELKKLKTLFIFVCPTNEVIKIPYYRRAFECSSQKYFLLNRNS